MSRPHTALLSSPRHRATDQRRRSARSLGSGLCLLLALILSTGSALVAAEAWQKSLDKARLLAHEQDFPKALKAFHRAAKQLGEPHFEILIGQARCLSKMERFSEAAGLARRALPLATGDTELIAAHSQVATALYAGGQGSPSQLQGAVESFRGLIELSGDGLPVVRFNLGLALLALERDDEGVAELQRFVDQASQGRALAPHHLIGQAKSYIAEPRRARVPLVAEFSARTLDGQHFTDQSLLGKVVVFDFWATWCGPCVNAVPHLRRMARRHRDDPFVLLSISADRSLGGLEKFIDKHSMDWPQIHDPRRSLTGGIFKVGRYPTYLVVDHRGEILFKDSGWSPQAAAKLDRVVAKALAALEEEDKPAEKKTAED